MSDETMLMQMKLLIKAMRNDLFANDWEIIDLEPDEQKWFTD